MRKYACTIYITLFNISLIAQVPVAHFTASDTAICGSLLNVNFTDLSTNSPTNWKWYFSGATPSTSILQNPSNIAYNGVGCHTVKLVVKNGSGSDSLTVSNYICLDTMPHILISPSTICRYVPTYINISGGTLYIWGGVDTTSSFGPVNAFVDLLYSIRVYNGVCYKDTIFGLDVDTCLGIQEAQNYSQFQVFPNPSNGAFTLQVKSEELRGKSNVEIYNVLGEKVYSNQFLTPNSQFLIDLSNQPNGVYLYRVIAENGELVGEGKLIILK